MQVSRKKNCLRSCLLKGGETEFQDDPIQVIAGRLIVLRFLRAE